MLRRAYKLAADHEPPKVARVPKFDLSAENNARMNFFTGEQLDKIRAEASKEGPQWRALIELAIGLGWRRGELLSLNRSNFDLSAGVVRINTSKSREPREVPLTKMLLAFVKPLIVGKAPDDLIFPDCQDIRYGWRRIRKAASVPHALFHDFRRTAARNKRAVGVDATIIMELQGWKSIAMFQRYGIVSHKDKLAALRRAEEAERELRSRTIDAQSDDSINVTH